MTTLYRAQYRTRAGTVRRMTFASAGGIKAAHAYASSFCIGTELLHHVEAVRECERPQFDLLTQEAGQ